MAIGHMLTGVPHPDVGRYATGLLLGSLHYLKCTTLLRTPSSACVACKGHLQTSSTAFLPCHLVPSETLSEARYLTIDICKSKKVPILSTALPKSFRIQLVKLQAFLGLLSGTCPLEGRVTHGSSGYHPRAARTPLQRAAEVTILTLQIPLRESEF